MTTQDLNDLYRRMINSNHRFRKLKELHAPDIIVNNEHRVFDDAVSALLSEGEIAHMVNGVGADAFINYFNYIAGTEIGFPIAAAGAA